MLEKGKLPPQAVDVERVILGAILLDTRAIAQVVEIFKSEVDVFYKQSYQLIYQAMLDMFEESEPIDLLTLSKKLRANKHLEKVGGDYELVEISQSCMSSAHIDYHCRIVQQMFIKRRAIKTASNIIEMAYEEDTDVFDLLEDSYSELDDVSEWMLTKRPKEFKELVDDYYSTPKELKIGVPSSLSKLQKKLNGYQDSNLVILAARPGMGKTALVINEALHAAVKGYPVGIFSLEMSARELLGRMLAAYCGINVEKVSLRNLSESDYELMESKKEQFQRLPISIDDQQGITPLYLNITANRWKREKGVKMIFVDYLQLMNSNVKSAKGNREQEVSAISRSLKGLAKDMDVPVMALSQLSRAVEQRGGMKRPILSDLRESGAIEQDADIVMFLLRPEYYRILEWDDDDNTSTRNTAEINIAKFRNGKVGSCLVRCNLEFMKFSDYESANSYPVHATRTQDDADDFEPDAKPLPTLDPYEDNDDLPF